MQSRQTSISNTHQSKFKNTIIDSIHKETLVKYMFIMYNKQINRMNSSEDVDQSVCTLACSKVNKTVVVEWHYKRQVSIYNPSKRKTSE